MATASDIRNGLCLKHNGDIYSVVEFQQVKQARAAGFYRVKMKNLRTGSTIETKFNSSAKIEPVRVERHTYQYLYDEGDTIVLMHQETYEQINIAKAAVDNLDLLPEGETVEVLINTEDDSPLTVEIPPKVVWEITYTEPGLRGDTATNTLKPAKIKTGAEIKVPLFINIGDKIRVDTAGRSYVERVKE
ncbi:MAG: elongation factor P [Bacteroidota bacterium]